jgi:hypothetical protein
MFSSCDAAVLEEVPEDIRKLVGRIVQKWWKPHALPEAPRRLEAAHAATISDFSD